jgi:hypothetical protein
MESQRTRHEFRSALLFIWHTNRKLSRPELQLSREHHAQKHFSPERKLTFSSYRVNMYSS